MQTKTFVRQVRQELDLRQLDFAAALGVSRATIVRYENGASVRPIVLRAIRQLREQHKRKRKT
jgi:DNA-binding XRE family transcriptional regulator